MDAFPLPASYGKDEGPRTTGTIATKEEAHFRSCNLPEPTVLTDRMYSTNHGADGHGILLIRSEGGREITGCLKQRRQGYVIVGTDGSPMNELSFYKVARCLSRANH